MPQCDIRNLAPNEKYSLLVNHFKPNSNFKFPSRYLDGCHRSCQHKYLADNPCFVYSKAEDGLYCLPCVLFASRDDLGQFVSEKFNLWTKKSRKFADHNSKKYHHLALARADALKSSIMDPASSIACRLKEINDSEIVKNRYIIKCMVDAILVCGRQCIALRGHRDDSTADPLSNKGNFLALLDYSVRSGNTALDTHLKECGRNALYTSKTIQNDLIECIGDYLRGKILGEIKLATWYSVLCDEVTDVASKEQLSLVLRFVDADCCLREEFLDFITTERITGEVLACKIKESLTRYGINLADCRGQGYDGASNMASVNGVQGRILAENPKATYVHCNSHILNLCIVQSCSLSSIRNMNSSVTETAYFFHNSAKRQLFLEKVVNNETSTVKVKDLCRTRWVYRHEAYENFFILYKYLVITMEAIVSRDDQYGKMNWDSKTIVAANGLLKMFRSFTFVISFISTMNAMAIIKPISIKLQKRSNDIVRAYNEVTSVIEELITARGDSEVLHGWYVQSEVVAGEIDVTPEVPRTASRQIHRDNVEHSTPEEYYRRSIILPLLDSLIQQMKDRFSKTQIVVAKLINLIPSVLCSTSNRALSDTINFYEADLPNPSVVSTEVWRWRAKWQSEDADTRPSTLESALIQCDRDYFPNINVLLRIACTIPVTSCENERANSALKNLKTFLRSSMGQERLSSLALMHIHYTSPVNLDSVVDMFKLKCNRRIPL